MRDRLGGSPLAGFEAQVGERVLDKTLEVPAAAGR
jgi:hypothetical protein